MDEAMVQGNIEYLEKGHQMIEERTDFDRFMAQVSGQIFSFLAALLIGGIFIAFLPSFYQKVYPLMKS